MLWLDTALDGGSVQCFVRALDDNVWDGAATRRSTDGFLLNVALASAGTSYLRVLGEGANNTGSYELLARRQLPDDATVRHVDALFARVPKPKR